MKKHKLTYGCTTKYMYNKSGNSSNACSKLTSTIMNPSTGHCDRTEILNAEWIFIIVNKNTRLWRATSAQFIEVLYWRSQLCPTYSLWNLLDAYSEGFSLLRCSWDRLIFSPCWSRGPAAAVGCPGPLPGRRRPACGQPTHQQQQQH